MMMVWALMGHIINIIFKMKYELHVYEIENVFKKWNEKKKKQKKNKRISFWKMILKLNRI